MSNIRSRLSVVKYRQIIIRAAPPHTITINPKSKPILALTLSLSLNLNITSYDNLNHNYIEIMQQRSTYMKNYIKHNQNFLPLTFRSLSEVFVRRSLFSSSSGYWHGSDAMWQEIGRMSGSVYSCPHLGS